MKRRNRKFQGITQEIEAYTAKIQACHTRIKTKLQETIDLYNNDPHLRNLGIRIADILSHDDEDRK